MLNEFMFAFVAGAIATANPCGFALLPAYLARRLNTGEADQRGGFDGIIPAMGVGAATTLGFLLVFGLAGAVISLGAYWLTESLPWAGFIIGITLSAIGAATILGWRMNVRLPVIGVTDYDGWRGDLFFGLGFGTASLSCTFPIFLLVMGTATTDGPAAGAFSFVAYALGMGSILTALAVSAAIARQGLAARIKRLGPYLDRLSGGLLFLAGVYVSYIWGRALFAADPLAKDSITDTGALWSGIIQTWMDSPDGEAFVVGLFLALTALFSWAMARRFLAGRRMGNSSDPTYTKRGV